MDETDHFRESFKYFKQKNIPEMFNDIIDLEATDAHGSLVTVARFTEENESCTTCIESGLLHHQTWKVYSFPDVSGFFFLRNPFSVVGQQLWIQKCMELYPRKPNITNLDLHHKHLIDIDLVQLNGVDKLSWATLGYHYNWETKEYNPVHRSRFPECLAALSKHVASHLGFETFRPETAIVNYYNKKSSLGIHNDHSEKALNEPIISFSFGQTAIFLFGTDVKKDKPIPIFLRSGDIVVFSGASRLSYHAIPAIISEPVESRYSLSNENDFEKPYYQYITKHRINISVRQVYHQNSTLS